MSWTVFVIITGAFLIVIVLLVLSLLEAKERLNNLESSVHTLWGSVNRLGDNDDELRGRVWKLEHEDGKQND